MKLAFDYEIKDNLIIFKNVGYYDKFGDLQHINYNVVCKYDKNKKLIEYIKPYLKNY